MAKEFDKKNYIEKEFVIIQITINDLLSDIYRKTFTITGCDYDKLELLPLNGDLTSVIDNFDLIYDSILILIKDILNKYFGVTYDYNYDNEYNDVTNSEKINIIINNIKHYIHEDVGALIENEWNKIKNYDYIKNIIISLLESEQSYFFLAKCIINDLIERKKIIPDDHNDRFRNECELFYLSNDIQKNILNYNKLPYKTIIDEAIKNIKYVSLIEKNNIFYSSFATSMMLYTQFFYNPKLYTRYSGIDFTFIVSCAMKSIEQALLLLIYINYKNCSIKDCHGNAIKLDCVDIIKNYTLENFCHLWDNNDFTVYLDGKPFISNIIRYYKNNCRNGYFHKHLLEYKSVDKIFYDTIAVLLFLFGIFKFTVNDITIKN